MSSLVSTSTQTERFLNIFFVAQDHDMLLIKFFLLTGLCYAIKLLWSSGARDCLAFSACLSLSLRTEEDNIDKRTKTKTANEDERQLRARRKKLITRPMTQCWAKLLLPFSLSLTHMIGECRSQTVTREATRKWFAGGFTCSLTLETSRRLWRSSSTEDRPERDERSNDY